MQKSSSRQYWDASRCGFAAAFCVCGRINKFNLDALINLAARAGLCVRSEVAPRRRSQVADAAA
jgi:hypothetical protein